MPRATQTSTLLSAALTGIWIVAAGLALGFTYSLFRAGGFAFHDLGLINDFLATTARSHRFFYVPALDLNHLTVHFSPALLTLLPFYALWDSQYLLIFLGIVAIFLAISVQFSLFQEKIRKAGLSSGTEQAGQIFFLILLLFNPYTKTLILSAHFEIFYVLFATLAFRAIIAGQSWVSVVLWTTLALGMRQDAGLYLGFQMLALLFFPQSFFADGRRPNRRIFAAALGSFIYTAIAVKVILPALGSSDGFHIQRFWGDWGKSWGEIGFNILTSPWRVLRSIYFSGFKKLVLLTGGISLVNAPAFALLHAPGLLLYISNAHDKNNLYYYNSAFLLPGILIAGSVTVPRALSYLEKRSYFRAALVSLAAASVLFVYSTSFVFDEWREYRYYSATDATIRKTAIEEWLTRCPHVKAVSAEFADEVFLPNHVVHYLWDSWQKADLVFWRPSGDMRLFSIKNPADIRSLLLLSKKFTLASKPEEPLEVWVASPEFCR